MKLCYPSYYKKFKCTAGNCTDNCCIGWEIDIDDKTYDYYKSLEADIMKNISLDYPHHFILQNERCPFLNSQNLCEIISHFGEEKLCCICRDHPRYFEWLGNVKQAGLGLCCEEACRLILTENSRLCYETINEKPDSEVASVKPLLFAQDKAMLIAQNNDITLNERILQLVIFAEKLQNCLDCESCDKIYDICSSYKTGKIIAGNGNKKSSVMSILNLFKQMETIDTGFIDVVNEIECSIDDILNISFSYSNSEFSKMNERLIVYYIFRYFMKSAYDSDVLGKIHFAAAAYLFNSLSDSLEYIKSGSLTLQNKIKTAVLYSKQVEYSDVNIELLTDASIDTDVFSTENLISAFL